MFMIVKYLVKTKLFFEKNLVDSRIVCTFALAFEKSSITLRQDKERVL